MNHSDMNDPHELIRARKKAEDLQDKQEERAEREVIKREDANGQEEIKKLSSTTIPTAVKDALQRLEYASPKWLGAQLIPVPESAIKRRFRSFGKGVTKDRAELMGWSLLSIGGMSFMMEDGTFISIFRGRAGVISYFELSSLHLRELKDLLEEIETFGTNKRPVGI